MCDALLTEQTVCFKNCIGQMCFFSLFLCCFYWWQFYWWCILLARLHDYFKCSILKCLL